jgi:predicted RNA-binding protein YlxR (DUF448 family)
MPDRFKDRLRALTANDRNIEVDFSAERNGRGAFAPHMRAALGELRTLNSVHFRLDDDDALAIDYIERLRFLTAVAPATTHISMPFGLVVFPVASGSTEGTSIPDREMLCSPGLAMVCGPGFYKNIFMMMHGSVWERFPLMSDPRRPAYIRTHHSENDTANRQDLFLVARRAQRFGRNSETFTSEVDRILAESFSYIDQPTLNGLIGRIANTTSLADLAPVATAPALDLAPIPA